MYFRFTKVLNSRGFSTIPTRQVPKKEEKKKKEGKKEKRKERRKEGRKE
jgi:hypothetical protein